MPLKCYIYTTNSSEFMYRYQTTMLVYMPHMNFLQSTV